MSVLITQIVFWDCRVHFIFLLFFSDKLFGKNFIRLTAYLQLDIYDNLHSHLIYVFSKSVQVGEGEGSVGAGRCQLNEELIDIQKLNYKNYTNSPTLTT